MIAVVLAWARRYLPAECAGLACALICGLAASYAFATPALTALSGAWGEMIGYYTVMFRTEIQSTRPIAGHTLRPTLRAVRNLVVEFAGAELLDTLLIRPAAIYALTIYSGSIPVGLLLGKLSADVTFYVPVIAAYEWRKRHLS
jgi:hypothetical protein